MKKVYELKVGHGYFGGYVRETDIISTVDTGMWKWHILLVEEECEDTNLSVAVKDNTKKGYQIAYDKDGIDLGLHRKNHRGTVKHGISHTIKTECDAGVIEING